MSELSATDVALLNGRNDALGGEGIGEKHG